MSRRSVNIATLFLGRLRPLGTFRFNTAEIIDIDLRTYPRAYLFKSSQLLYAVISKNNIKCKVKYILLSRQIFISYHHELHSLPVNMV